MSYNLALPFHRRSVRHPARVALTISGAPYTYGQLHLLSGRIAAWLRTGAEPGRVGILASRSLSSYAGILGSCWAGAAYVPLNPRFPAPFLLRQIARARLDALVVDSSGLEVLSKMPVSKRPRRILAPDADPTIVGGVPIFGRDRLPEAAAVDAPRPMAPEDVAYLMFTSGTTGESKGVAVSVGNVRRYVEAVRSLYEFKHGDRFSQFFEITADTSLFDLFTAWDAGASVHVVPYTQRMFPGEIIRRQSLTVWFSSPSAAALMLRMNMLKPGAFPTLRNSLFAGESLPQSVAQAWQRAAPHSRVVNLYGPTEATVACFHQTYRGPRDVTPGEGIVSIGKPLPGMHGAVAGPSGKFLRRGQRGELLLGGAQVALGYWEDPVLTARKFRRLDHPRLGRSRWYATGDRAYQDRSGRFHFLGRLDRQIKVLGQRVQLEDVEAHLRSVCGCAVAAVAWPIVGGAIQGLAAFVGDKRLDIARIVERLRRRVPTHLVPGRIILLDEMPLNAAGKIDEKALLRLLSEQSQGAPSRH